MYPSERGCTANMLHDLLPYLTRRKGPTGWSSCSTAAQVAANFEGKGRVAIVTGCSGGLGLESVRVLASRGCDVVMAVRDVEAVSKAAQQILEQQPSAKLTVMHLDLSSLASVRGFTAQFLATGKQLNILINNAAVMACPFGLSADGHELQFATNHLGHFLLVKLLLPHMLDVAKSQGREGRVVTVASLGHHAPYPGGFRWESLDSSSGYAPFKAYGQSKLANLLFARELAVRLQGQPIVSATLHPGAIFTGLDKFLADMMPRWVYCTLRVLTKPFFKSIPQGAATQVFLATAPPGAVISGEYYSDVNPAPASALAHNAALGRKLWEVSETLITPYMRKDWIAGLTVAEEGGGGGDAAVKGLAQKGVAAEGEGEAADRHH